MATSREQQHDAGSQALCGQGEGQRSSKGKPDPVTKLSTSPHRNEHIQKLYYYYDQEKNDDVKFDVIPNDDGMGFRAEFRVLRSSSSSKKDVLNISLVIPNNEREKFEFKVKKKKKFFRVKLIKTSGSEDLDLAKYFSLKDKQSSSDEEQKAVYPSATPRALTQ